MRRLIACVLTTIALVVGANSVSWAQSRPSKTRHVRDVTLNVQAKFVQQLSASQQMRIVLVLPLPNEAALDQFLKDVYDPSSPSYRL